MYHYIVYVTALRIKIGLLCCSYFHWPHLTFICVTCFESPRNGHWQNGYPERIFIHPIINERILRDTEGALLP